MASALIARSLILVFGLLYPSYMSYKAVRTRSVQAYVKWMMYWIVFALFYNVETITDLVLSWFPLYYELKVIFVFWLLSPQTQGSELIYKLYVHPHLTKHEEELDQVWDKVKDQGYTALVQVGAQGLNLALQGAIKGQTVLVERINQRERRDNSDSLRISEITDDEHMDSGYQDAQIEEPLVCRPRNLSHKFMSSPSLQRNTYHEPEPDVPPFMRRSRPSYQTQVDRTDAAPFRRQSSQSSIMTRSFDSTSTSREQFSRSYEDSSHRTPAVTPLHFDPIESRRNRQSEYARHRASLNTRNSSISAQSSMDSNCEDRSSASRSGGAIPKVLKNNRSLPTKDSSSNISSKSKNAREQKRSQKARENREGQKTAEAQANDDQTEVEAEEHEKKYTRSEATLRYRTKKISDIKHNQIRSPFISML